METIYLKALGPAVSTNFNALQLVAYLPTFSNSVLHIIVIHSMLLKSAMCTLYYSLYSTV